MTDKQRLEEIKARCEAATKGPWKAGEGGFDVTTLAYSINNLRTGGYGSIVGGDFICDLNDGEYHEYYDEKEQIANANFIAHSREDVPWLIERLEEAWREIDRMQGGRKENR